MMGWKKHAFALLALFALIGTSSYIGRALVPSADPASWAGQTSPPVEGSTFLLDTLLTTGVRALVRVSSVLPQGEPADDGEQSALVEVEEVLWETVPKGEAEWRPLAEGPTLVTDLEESWATLSQAFDGDTAVFLGLGIGPETPPSFGLNFAIGADSDEETVDLISPKGHELGYQFDAYMTWEGNPFTGGNDVTQEVVTLLKLWNVEASVGDENAPPGPVQVSWNRFVEEVLFPEQEWADLPSDQRSLSDAPTAVTATMTDNEIWFEIPDAWKLLTDAAICLNTSQGSNGCVHVNAVDDGGHLVPIDALGVAGEDMVVEVRPLDASMPGIAVDFDGGIEIGRIPAALLLNDVVLLSLNPLLAPGSYGDLSDDVPGVSRITSTLLDEDTLALLLEEEPEAPSCTEEC